MRTEVEFLLDLISWMDENGIQEELYDTINKRIKELYKKFALQNNSEEKEWNI